ncbi:MAG: biofilm PGA synthesis N-glycosyltransferase PgaC [Clostridium sp.]|jgi:biofilm PGA synthesis N-glycosyltransferase PgaC
MLSYKNSELNKKAQYKRKFYISVFTKFLICHIFALLWTIFAIYISINWIKDFSKIVSLPVAIIIITGIAYIPGYLNTFLIISLIMDKQTPLKNENPSDDITILIAARNEAGAIADTLSYIATQDYNGACKILVIDNGSDDATASNAIKEAARLNLDVSVIREETLGKYNALNTGLESTTTDLVITLDADTILHKSAVRYLVARIKNTNEVCAVAGCILVRNSRDNLLTKMQEWDYFLGISSIKRMQGLYQGVLVAQGAFSIYKTKNIEEVGGWPNAIGEDIVLTWNLLNKGWKTYFEPLAVAFTDVPTNLHSFSSQRSRWARGMIEALKKIQPWKQPKIYIKYLTSVNFIMPYLDFVYTFCWLPGLFLTLFGIYWIVGPMTLLVLPLTFISYGILYKYQQHVFKSLNLRVRNNLFGLTIFVLFYQMIMSPVSVWGYLQELFKSKRKWK